MYSQYSYYRYLSTLYN